MGFKSLFSFIYKPIVDLYRLPKAHEKNRKLAEYHASILNAIRVKSETETLVVVFSDEDTPPLYADFLVVVLLVRFLVLNNFQIRFYISEFGQSGDIWNALSDNEREEYFLERKKIIEFLLPKDTQVVFTKESRRSINKSESFTKNVILNQPSIDRMAPYIIQLLIERYGFSLPNNFLLPQTKHLEYGSYIAFGIRLSKWAAFRDSRTRTILKDFSALINAFPGKNIMILSNPSGLDHAFNALFNTSRVKIIQYRGIKVIPQPKTGYFNGMNYLLGSEFYFQRSGGGMVVPAIFSSTPYLFFHQIKTNFYGAKNRKIIIWSKINQIYVHIPKMFIELLPINYFIQKFFIKNSGG